MWLRISCAFPGVVVVVSDTPPSRAVRSVDAQHHTGFTAEHLGDDVRVDPAGAGGGCGGVARVLRVLQYLLVVAVCGRIQHRRRSRRRRGGGGRMGGSS